MEFSIIDVSMEMGTIYCLWMYYGFEKYYEERKNTMQYNEQLQELQLQNILPLRETYQQLDQEYYDQLNEIESELS